MIYSIKNLKEVFLNELLGKYSKNEVRSLIYIVLQHYLSLTRTEITAYPHRIVDDTAAFDILSALTRLKEDEPVQYITGETEFCGLKIKTDKRALIPRPETEELVTIIKEHLKTWKKKSKARIIDICTGSGCIAISLKKFFPETEMYAVDNSTGALHLAAENAKLNNTPIQLINSDVLKWYKAQLPSKLQNQQFDLIVSNPPYVLRSEEHLLPDNVRKYEPSSAIIVNNRDPLIFYRQISSMNNLFVKNGLLFFEVNERLGKTICALLKHNGFSKIQLTKDLNGKERFITAVYI